METYIDRMEYAKKCDKIVYYDYIKYKEASGWYDGFIAGN